MQINSIYLYPNRLDVYTSDTETWTQERFRMVYNRNLKVYRSADNRIDLQIRTGDQKTYNATGTTIVLNIVNKETSDLVLRKDCSVDDLAVGRVYATLTEAELQTLEPGFYDYSLHKETRENIDSTQYKVTSKSPIYLDSQYGAIGTLEVIGGMEGTPYDTVEVYKFNKSVIYESGQYNPSSTPQFNNPRPNFAQTNTSSTDYEEFQISSIIDAKPNLNTPNSLHTFQFYYKNYTGEVKIQGSLGEGGNPNENSWFDIKTYNITTANENEFDNVIGKYNWFRIKHTPASNNTGSLDKVLYR